jgi:MATE family multidrug resistance protein
VLRDIDLEGGQREVMGLAWPLAVGMLSFTLMGVADTLVMGYVGTTAQAGVGLGAVFVWTFRAFFRGATSGAQSLVAAADGAGDRDRVERAASAGLLVGTTSGIIAAVLLGFATAFALPLLVEDAAMAGSASRYLEVRVWGLPVTLTAFGLMGGLQGLGDSKARMQASIAGNVVNIVLDVVLVFGLGPFPRMGEAGAALATVIGAVVMLLVYAWRFRRLLGRPRLPGREVLSSALAVGLPAGSQSLLETIAFAVMNIVLAQVGSVDVAARQIVLNIVSVSFLPGYALAEAGGILVGRYVGSGGSEGAKRSLQTSRNLALVFMGVCGVLFAVAGGPIVSLFTRDPEVVALASQLMFVAAAFQLFDAVAMVHLSVLRAVGDTRYTLLVTGLASWTMLVPATFAFGIWFGWGAVGAWLGLLLEIAFLAVVTAWRVPGIYDGRVVRMKLLLGRG